MRILRKFVIGVLTFVVLFAASLWATSLAIEEHGPTLDGRRNTQTQALRALDSVQGAI